MEHKFELLGVKISATNLAEASSRIEQWIAEKKKAYICVAPVSTIVECQRNPDYRSVVNSADMATPDGMPVVWLGKRKGYSVERTYGPDLMLAVSQMCEQQGRKFFLLGATEETLGKLKGKLSEQFPQLQITGMYSPPFRPLSVEENQDILNRINQSAADIVWVGLGAPKQDFWMSENRAKLDAPVLVGVGAAFDFLSGIKRQAPRWMQRSGLEWLFRLACEPRRLWKRYLIGNTVFVYLLIKETLRKKVLMRA